MQRGAEAVYDDVLAEVQRLKALYPTYAVKVTGHSLGAAHAQLTSMSLIKDGIPVEHMYNFGQPRTGDSDYAAFCNATFKNQYRVVHYKDPVPHSPPTWPVEYHHTATEYFETEEVFSETSLKQCDGSGEDPTCSDKWHTW